MADAKVRVPRRLRGSVRTAAIARSKIGALVFIFTDRRDSV